MSQDAEGTFVEARDALEAHDPRTAFIALRSLLRYPGDAFALREWFPVLELFARVCEHFAGAALGTAVRAAKAGTARALYDAGYELVAKDLPDVAATFLARAMQRAPGDATIAGELVTALERSGFHADAVRVIQALPAAVRDDDFALRYLLAFNAVCAGQLQTARAEAPWLQARAQGATTPRDPFMAATIVGMLQRADAARTAGRTLDATDLRGWQWVIDGTILLHESPHGRAEGMNGRYAFVQDDPGRLLEGIRKLGTVLDAFGVFPPRVFVLPERESEIVAQAVARVFSRPLERFPDAPTSAPGLLASYDVAAIPGNVLQIIQAHVPGQTLWSHAACWTDPFVFAPDVTTFLHQSNRSPWGPRLTVDPASGRPQESPADTSPTATLADAVVKAQPDPHAMDDLADLQRLVAAARTVTGDAAVGVLRTQGRRRRQYGAAPVPSNRFS